MKLHGLLKRVDIQVMLLTTIIVILATVSCTSIMYNVTYTHTLDNIRYHAEYTYELVSQEITKTDFEVITLETDVNVERYKELQKELAYVSKAAGISYIFTAYMDDEGVIRHHVSNLTPESQNYKSPGQVVDPRTYDKISHTFEGQRVYPSDIKNLEIGQFYSFYYPILNGEEVIGAVGIIFDASRQYQTFRNIRIFIPIIIGLSLLLAGVVSYIVFKRISNPFYQDMSNTDIMTGLKNRNAYQIDLNNMIVKNEMKNVGVVVFDLNGLKKLNDEKGHDAGDRFICNFANSYKNLKERIGVMYRIGGDEFVVFIPDATKEIIKTLLRNVKEEFYNFKETEDLSYSVGYAIFDEELDKNINKTIRRADELMYKFKRQNN